MMESFCGFRLNTAGVVIGWIGAAISFLAIIVFALGLANIDALTKFVMDQVKDSSMTEDGVRRVLIIVFSAYITINLINMVASALLVAGTVKERHLLLVPWLINSGFSLLFGALYAVYMLTIAVSESAPFNPVAFPLISAGISLAFHSVIWYAIYSLFKKLQAGRDQQQQLLRTTAGSSYPSYTKI